MNFAWRVLACGILALVTGGHPARADDVTLCNKDKSTLEFVMLWDEGIPPLIQTWHAKGWYKIAPGECQKLLESDNRRDVYLSVLSLNGDKASINHYEVHDLTKETFLTDTMYGIEEFYCVKADSFSRVEQNLGDHQKCPPDYYLQLFNMFLFSPISTDLTATLR